MKKLISFLIVLLMLAALLVSCKVSDEDDFETNAYDYETDETTLQDDTEEITEKKEELIKWHKNDSNNINIALASKIKKAYCKFFNCSDPESIAVNRYIDLIEFKIEGCDIVGVIEDGVSYSTSQRTENVAGFSLTFDDGQPIYIHKDGSFYTISEAYENGIITKRDVYNFGLFCTDHFRGTTSIPVGKDEMIPKHLSDDSDIEESIASEIKKAYCEFDNCKGWEYAVCVIRYEGEIEGCHIAMISGTGRAYELALRAEKVAGYTIRFGDSQRIYVYKDGNFYTIAEAYEQGVLSKAGVYEFGKRVSPDFEKNNPAP